MIFFGFNIKNSFSNRFKEILCYQGPTLLKNLFWEVQCLKTNGILGIELSYTARQDHAGLCVCLTFIGYELILSLYDIRHWDSHNRCFINKD